MGAVCECSEHTTAVALRGGRSVRSRALKRGEGLALWQQRRKRRGLRAGAAGGEKTAAQCPHKAWIRDPGCVAVAGGGACALCPHM